MAADTTLELARRVQDQLQSDFPDAQCALVHESPFQLLIATILAAQCTDERVNQVTRELFKTYPHAADFAVAPIEDIEEAVRPTGFYRNKAKSIKACCQRLVDDYDGQVPSEMGRLIDLPGIGRKTANLVLGVSMGVISGIVVDTHVGRVSRRLGLTENKDAVKVEKDLMRLVPEENWVHFSHQMILHGRSVCAARKPKCETCSMTTFCPQIDIPA